MSRKVLLLYPGCLEVFEEDEGTPGNGILLGSWNPLFPFRPEAAIVADAAIFDPVQTLLDALGIESRVAEAEELPGLTPQGMEMPVGALIIEEDKEEEIEEDTD